MTAELSRRIAAILGRNIVTPQERRAVIAAAEKAGTWDELPDDIRRLLDQIARRGASAPS